MINNTLTIENIKNQLETNGFASYKRSTILKSDKLDGWYMNAQKTVFADNISELLFDLDSLMVNIDYDNGILI